MPISLPPVLSKIALSSLDLQQAFTKLADVYQEVSDQISKRQMICNMRGICCDFDRADHRLYATKLEIAYFISESGLPTGVTPSTCPWFSEGKCFAREGRVLGCRAYFCTDTDGSSDLYEGFFVGYV